MDGADRRRAVDDLVGCDAGDGRAEDDARGVAARLGGVKSDGLEPAQICGHVLDPDPVQLDVLPVGDVGGVAREVRRDVGDGAQLREVQLAAVDAHAQHEVLVVELLGLERARSSAVDAGLALGVEAPPAEPAAQVAWVDRVEPAVRVDVLDARADVQAVVVLLGPLVGVERLKMAEGPLAFTAMAARSRRHGGPPGDRGTRGVDRRGGKSSSRGTGRGRAS